MNPAHRANKRRGRTAALAAVVTASIGLSPATALASAPIGASHTLHLAFGADMQVPDPDIFYEVEGNAVVTSVYEGLVKYADNSTKIVPCLATSWTVTDGGKTYTFYLRHNVHFHDGSVFTAADAVFSFDRRKGVDSAPEYMVADVTSMATPTPYTFVVHLSQPVAAFLDYMASPYGPKMVSEETVVAHESGGHPGDWAQGWLKTHDAGTGPYQITAFVPGQPLHPVRVPGLLGHQAVLQDGTDQHRPRRFDSANRAPGRSIVDGPPRPADQRCGKLPAQP